MELRGARKISTVEMTVVSGGSYSFSTQLIVLCLVLYPLIVATSAMDRKTRPTLAAAVLPLMLTPILLSLIGCWLTMAKLFQLMALTRLNHPSAAAAAGAAEAQALLVFGAVIAAFMSAVAMISELRTRTATPARARGKLWQIVGAIVALLLICADFAVSNAVVMNGFAPAHAVELSETAAIIAATTAIASFGWLVVARSRDWRLHDNPLFTAIICLCASVAVAVAGWLVTEHFVRIATGVS